MSNVERRFLWLCLAMMAAYLVLYQFYSIPSWRGLSPIISKPTLDQIGWFTLILVVGSIALSLRDLYYRDVSAKAGWVVGILFFTWVGLPYYFIKHARKPRSVKSAIGRNTDQDFDGQN